MKVGGRNAGGYTLVEVIVAAGIFAMVIAGGITGVRMGLQIIDSSRHYTRVSQILQSEVEGLRSLSWKEIKELPGDSEIDIKPEFGTKAYDAYTVTRSIDSESATLRRVEIIVEYTTRNGKQHELQYLTYFTQGGVNDYYYRKI